MRATDRYKIKGNCDQETIAVLDTALDGKARFVMFVSITDDFPSSGEQETEEPVTKKKIKTRYANRTTWFRLHVFDLADRKLVWNHRTFVYLTADKSRDVRDVIKHGSKEGVLASIATSVANSILKPDPKYPPTPSLEKALGKAFDRIGKLLVAKKNE